MSPDGSVLQAGIVTELGGEGGRVVDRRVVIRADVVRSNVNPMLVPRIVGKNNGRHEKSA